MAEPVGGYLIRQFDLAWMLASYHLESLTTEECLWRPASRGLHVTRNAEGVWVADWPDHEGYDLGPPSAAWTTWHMIYWWSTVLDHSFGEARLTREQVAWPGTADGVRSRLDTLHSEWRAAIVALDDDALASKERTRWPLTDRPLGDVVAWATVELTKNAAELGSLRFLYGARSA